MILLVGFLIYWYVGGGSGPDASTYLVLGTWMIAVVLLGYAAERVWLKYVGRGQAIWLLFPGALLHRLSHAAAALVLGCSVTSLRLYTPSRDDVGYSAPPARWLGAFVVALAPILAGLFVIDSVHQATGKPLEIGDSAPMKVLPTRGGARRYAHKAWEATKETWRAVGSEIDFHDWRSWVFLYLVIAITVTLSPTRRELPVVLIGIVAAAVALFLLEHGGAVELLKRDEWAASIKTLWAALTLAVLAAEASCVGALVAAGLCRLFRTRSGAVSASGR